MAYNVLKRPMFKRGGSTTGTGIMSHVEPKTIGGGAISGNNMPNNRTGFQSPILTIGEGMASELARGKPGFTSTPFAQYSSPIGPTRTGFQAALTRFPRALPLGLYGAGATVGIGLGGLLDFYARSTKTPEQMKRIKEMSEFGIMDETNLDVGEAMKYIEEGGKIGEAPGFFPRGGKKKYFEEKGLDPETGLPVEKDFLPTPGPKKVEIAKIIEQQKKEKTDKPEPKYEEADIKTDIENEIDLLTEVLGPSVSKGEKALLIAKAFGTPGGLSEKLKVAQEEGLKLARQKTSDERAIKLAAYKAAKDIEKTKIAAGKLGETERLYDKYAELKIKKDKTPKEQALFESLEIKLSKTDEGEKLSGAVAAKIYDPNEIISLENRINELEAKVKRSKVEEQELETKKKRLAIQKKAESFLPGFGNFENGGRVMKQMGGPMEENNIASIENVTQDQVEPTKTVQTLSYAELRDRLPKEITDDIVQLISASERALQDFAYIRTQQDVNDFNAKYGVNLVLPASAT